MTEHYSSDQTYRNDIQNPTSTSPGNTNDVEKGDDSNSNLEKSNLNNHGVGVQPGLRRQLKNRHVAMISIGGVIGTGLFLGTANALAHGGPLGLLLGYTVMGTIVYSIMICLGEMISHLPLSGGHITLASRFVDQALSFTMGWNYWYNWTIVLPAELNAAAVLISYWDTTTSPAVWIAICLVIVIIINLFGTRVYGEVEFYFCIVKVLTIIGLIILGLIIDAGGVPGAAAIGSKYWRNPGPFVQYLGIQGAKGRFLGFWAVLIQAAFSYIGTEITAIAAGEAKNPKRNLPKAIRRVWVRICVFYIAGVFIIGLLVPSNDPRLNLATGTAVSSPFVIAIVDAGISVLPGIVNACLLTSATSAASSDLYTSSRALYGLALNGLAPKLFTRVTSWGLPWVTVLLGSAFGLLSFMSAGTKTAGEVFGYFANMTSVCGLLTWWSIAFTYIRFYNATKVQNIDRNEFPYKASLQPWLTYYALFMCSLILFFNGWSVFIRDQWDTATFITSYLPIMLFPILYLGSRFYFKTSMIPLDLVDFTSGSRDAFEEEEVPPKNLAEKIWNWVM